MAAGPIDRARWPVLSPLLDELLELTPAQREARLATLQAQDPALAEELAPWLSELGGLDHSSFLQAPALPAPPGLAGQAVGAYTLVRELGQGGMGSVWLAQRTDGRFEGEVAIKFLSAGLFSAAGAERFAREGRIMARLAHPHIARLLDAGHLAHGGPPQPYLVLEYVPGEPIDRHCSAQKLTLAQRLTLFLDVLDAVAHAHNRLILHRDLKPSNILVTAAGEVKLLDFGIAKLLDTTGSHPGESLTQQVGNAFTPQYAAPEQLQGGEVSTATDVYALGVLLFRLLGDRLPLEGPADNTLAQWQAVIERIPPRLSDVVLQAGGPIAEQAEQQDAERIHIGGGGHLATLQLLGCGVLRGEGVADLLGQRLARVAAGGVQQLRDAEVQQLDLAGRGDEDVRGLQVAVQDQPVVGVGHRVQHVEEECEPLGQRQLLRAAVAVDGLARHVFQHQVGLGRAPLGQVAGVQQPRDVGVCQARHDAALAGEALGAGGREQAGAEELDGHLAFKTAVGALGQPDAAHAALAELAHQGVGPHGLPGQARWGGQGRCLQKAAVVQAAELAQPGGQLLGQGRVLGLQCGQAGLALGRRELEQLVEQRGEHRPAGTVDRAGRHQRRATFRNRRALCQSRCTVRSVTSRWAAISASLRPPK